MTIDKQILEFLAASAFAVAGASNSRYKYGNKILRCYLQHKKEVYAINPNETVIETVQSYKSATECPDSVEAVSIITQPEISYQVVDDCIKKGIKHIWFQPGAQNYDAIEKALSERINVIYDGSCLLVSLGFREN